MSSSFTWLKSRDMQLSRSLPTSQTFAPQQILQWTPGLKLWRIRLMQWAQAITVESGRLAVELVNLDGARDCAALSTLATIGLPEAQGVSHLLEGVRLSELQRGNAQDYLQAFGFPRSATGEHHAIFVLKTQRRKYLIPALALLRALFRPTQHLLGEVFRPQAFERLTMPSPEDETRSIYLAHWKQSGAPVEQDSSLHWVSQDPAAKRMMQSVHRCALDGRVDLDLASIQLNLRMRGLAVGSTNFVTHVKASSARSSMDPTQTFDIGINHYRRASIAGATDSLKASLRADGQVAVSDEEWERIRGFFVQTKSGPPVTTDSRALLNGVLYKLTGATRHWKDVEKLGMSRCSVSAARQKWAKTGTLEKAVQELNNMRTHCQSHGMASEL